jgi:hypothetical protein
MRTLASVAHGNRADYVASAMHHLLGREKGSQRSVEAGILALAPAGAITVAAQRRTCTGFHLYALASVPLSLPCGRRRVTSTLFSCL